MSEATARGHRVGWGLPLLVAVMVLLPLLEIYLLVQVSKLIGGWWVVAILIVEAALGSWLVMRQGARAWAALNGAFATGKMPTGDLAETAFILIGAVLLILPGYLTDLAGLFFLLPFTRSLARKALAYLVARRLTKLGLAGQVYRSEVTVIEGETVPDADTDGPVHQTDGPVPQVDGRVIVAGEVVDGHDRPA